MDTKSIKVGVFSSIIASIIVIVFINPVLGFVWSTFLAVAGSVHQGYVDAIYVRAAVSYGGYQAVLVLAVFDLLLFWASGFLFLLSQTREIPGGTARVYRLHSAAWFCAAITLIIPVALNRGIFRITASFEQRLTVLAPTITDGEYKTLNARWASMQSKADYDAIVTTMDKRAAELSVTLPPVRKP
jgi:hypothetical protein